MLFNSLQFGLFFLFVSTSYFLLPPRFRWILLLLASCYFYTVFVPVYVLILGFTIFVDYWAGILIENSAGQRRRLFLVASLVANLGVLALFKYYNFLNSILADLVQPLGCQNPVPYLSILLPIGLSFHTFQAMSYTIEVYRGTQKAERHPGIYALYVMFFPQLVAGPIERPQNMLHQFREVHRFDWQRVMDGLKLMTWGLFKKVVIADRLAVMVDQVFDHPQGFDALPLILATVCFAVQIYCDFSGYSDMALGSAHVMGFRLMKNFDRPYFARSVAEFWRRWHISLSTWFRDYVYIPLGGSKRGFGRVCFNLIVTFLISGAWHGANWNFIVWGGLNGLLLVFEMATKTLRERGAGALGLDRMPRLLDVMRPATTFSLICLTWVFFRARTMEDACFIFQQGWLTLPSSVSRFLADASYRSQLVVMGSSFFNVGMVLLAIGLLFVVEITERRRPILTSLSRRPTWVRLGFYYVVLAAILFCGIIQTSQQFIYFQF
jgi:alginate O-acetyltransferase complex protein AlgI